MRFVCKKMSDFSDADYEKSLSMMTSERTEQINRITHDKTRRLSVLAELLCKQLAGEFLSRNIEEIIIKKDEKGKPFLAGENVHISISHSGEYVAAAVADTPVGIDIEVMKSPDMRVAERLCTESDREYLFGDNGEPQDIKFYKIWTAKEAYFKRKGTGITSFSEISYNELQPQHFIECELIITLIN